MNRKIKKALAILAIGCALLAVAGALALGYLYQLPAMRFLLNQAGFRQPDGCSRKEIFLTVEGERTSVMLYRHRSLQSDRYYYFQHGHTEKSNKHPALDRLASSLCDATGMNVLIPAFDMEREGVTLEYYFQRVAAVYQALAEKFRGRYRAFGACVGANLMLTAFRRLPPEIYPEKMLLTSPSFDGKSLVRAYEKMLGPDREHNLLFKIATTLDPSVFDEREKALMHRVSGDELFDEMVIFRTNRKILQRINAGTMFGPPGGRPRCTYFIIHSRQDNIVPFYQGEKLAEYMRRTGMSTDFLGTELWSHTENRVTVTGFVREAEQLLRFFDRLFQGDV
jgi:hypothetical protein